MKVDGSEIEIDIEKLKSKQYILDLYKSFQEEDQKKHEQAEMKTEGDTTERSSGPIESVSQDSVILFRDMSRPAKRTLRVSKTTKTWMTKFLELKI